MSSDGETPGKRSCLPNMSSDGETPVVLCGVRRNWNRTLDNFVFKDPSLAFFKLCFTVWTARSARPLWLGDMGQIGMPNSIGFEELLKFIISETCCII